MKSRPKPYLVIQKGLHDFGTSARAIGVGAFDIADWIVTVQGAFAWKEADTDM